MSNYTGLTHEWQEAEEVHPWGTVRDSASRVSSQEDSHALFYYIVCDVTARLFQSRPYAYEKTGQLSGNLITLSGVLFLRLHVLRVNVATESHDGTVCVVNFKPRRVEGLVTSGQCRSYDYVCNLF